MNLLNSTKKFFTCQNIEKIPIITIYAKNNINKIIIAKKLTMQ